ATRVSEGALRIFFFRTIRCMISAGIPPGPVIGPAPYQVPRLSATHRLPPRCPNGRACSHPLEDAPRGSAAERLAARGAPVAARSAVRVREVRTLVAVAAPPSAAVPL